MTRSEMSASRVEQPRRRRHLRALLERRPQPLEVGEVARDLARRRPGRRRADDQAPRLERQRPADRAQPRALVVGEPLADADPVAVGHVDHEAAGQRELHRQARALGAHRVLGRLHQHLVAALEQLGDLPLALRDPEGDDLVDVQEPVLLEADLDERGLHAGQDVLDPPLPDVAHHRALAAALDVDLGDVPVLQDRDARLGAVDRHQDLLRQGSPPSARRLTSPRADDRGRPDLGRPRPASPLDQVVAGRQPRGGGVADRPGGGVGEAAPDGPSGPGHQAGRAPADGAQAEPGPDERDGLEGPLGAEGPVVEGRELGDQA